MSAEVPPISKVITLLRSHFSPTQAPPKTPAARPDIIVSAGFCKTIRGVITPPLDAIIRKSPVILFFESEFSRFFTYLATFGPTNEASAVVVNRSNSRNCGEISEEVVIKASGIISPTNSLARRSCLGFR